MARALRFKFQSFVDINTRADTMQILQWSVGGNEVIQRCRHLFGAYKYFKLGKISVKMVPASTLPVDPLQLSYADDDPQSVDPRDQMNPGLVRITNGEDIFTDVASLNADQQVAVYNSMMLDPRWSKFMLQSGFRRSAYPLYWQVGQFAQDKYPGSTVNVPYQGVLDGTVARHLYNTNTADSQSLGAARAELGSSARGLFQVGHRGKLGWLPTDFYQQVATSGSGSDPRYESQYGLNNVPEVSVITCCLPKAYKTLYYYRVFITEEVLFSGLRSAPYVAGQGAIAGIAFEGIDQFLIGTPTPTKPDSVVSTVAVNPANNGGGQLP